MRLWAPAPLSILREVHAAEEVLEAEVGTEGVANSNIRIGPGVGGQVTRTMADSGN